MVVNELPDLLKDPRIAWSEEYQETAELVVFCAAQADALGKAIAKAKKVNPPIPKRSNYCPKHIARCNQFALSFKEYPHIIDAMETACILSGYDYHRPEVPK